MLSDVFWGYRKWSIGLQQVKNVSTEKKYFKAKLHCLSSKDLKIKSETSTAYFEIKKSALNLPKRSAVWT